MFDTAQDLIREKSNHPAVPVFDIRRLRRWYGEKGMTQQELAQLVGMTTRQLRRYESRPTIPRFLETLLTIAEALDTTLDDLIIPRKRGRGQDPRHGNENDSGNDTP